MPTIQIDESPQRLAEELAGLEHVDWPAIWAGPPYPGPALNDWCALFGWKPLPEDRVLAVRTATGGRLSLTPVTGGGWSPVRSLGWTTWDITADNSDENEQVLETAAEFWPRYEAAAREVLGTPEFSGAWDSPAFPEPRSNERWLPSPERRLRTRNPYRLTVWRGAGAEEPVIVLRAVSGGVTSRGVGLRGVMINVGCYPQETE
ncbi:MULTISPECIES: hypothetical protein [Streptomyces]|jgi:hypothetical protein|uniref:Uncharacterized protein n=2 Tax=Streptomyces bottropensis TaxID=42235 RepID=M3EV61_9ACTN|nr:MULTISPECIES: hypothetical protein [Streptomyces]EMF53033.1 hypothetical protein SBD_6109 [Streptomyces bottropensis ATCC 25435]MZD22069.1 hypothetical protein [Streptomyces sp. SID5476]